MRWEIPSLSTCVIVKLLITHIRETKLKTSNRIPKWNERNTNNIATDFHRLKDGEIFQAISYYFSTSFPDIRKPRRNMFIPSTQLSKHHDWSFIKGFLEDLPVSYYIVGFCLKILLDEVGSGERNHIQNYEENCLFRIYFRGICPFDYSFLIRFILPFNTRNIEISWRMST